jgi:hypothetical protein
LYGFVRANAGYLDGYEEAAVFGPNMPETRFGDSPPVETQNTSGGVYGFVRARPGQKDAPVVIHLIDWGEQLENVPALQDTVTYNRASWKRGETKPFILKLRNDCFFPGQSLSAQLLIPPVYNHSQHTRAEQTKNYSTLSRQQSLPLKKEGPFSIAQIPKLNPWGILVITQE